MVLVYGYRHAAFVFIWTGTSGTSPNIEIINDNAPLDPDAPNVPGDSSGQINTGGTSISGVGSAKRNLQISCSGLIHDDDSWDLFGGDEEESFNWSGCIKFQTIGDTGAFNQSQIVDGEVRLNVKLYAKVNSSGIITVSGSLELWEGPSWNLGDSVSVPPVDIMTGENKTIYQPAFPR
ncbi:hypothetical protein [Gimesia panareensis]|nr:hypothetical protein [Gimesia panareensis]